MPVGPLDLASRHASSTRQRAHPPDGSVAVDLKAGRVVLPFFILWPEARLALHFEQALEGVQVHLPQGGQVLCQCRKPASAGAQCLPGRADKRQSSCTRVSTMWCAVALAAAQA